MASALVLTPCALPSFAATTAEYSAEAFNSQPHIRDAQNWDLTEPVSKVLNVFIKHKVTLDACALRLHKHFDLDADNKERVAATFDFKKNTIDLAVTKLSSTSVVPYMWRYVTGKGWLPTQFCFDPEGLVAARTARLFANTAMLMDLVAVLEEHDVSDKIGLGVTYHGLIKADLNDINGPTYNESTDEKQRLQRLAFTTLQIDRNATDTHWWITFDASPIPGTKPTPRVSRCHCCTDEDGDHYHGM
jgi:hypothetical protein